MTTRDAHLLDPGFEFPVALFMLPSLGLFGFKLAQIMALYRSRVPCGWRDRIGAAVAGLALSHTIGKAVWKGLVIRSAFVSFRRVQPRGDVLAYRRLEPAAH